MGRKVIEIKSKNGTTYLYEDKSYWSKEKGYSTHERKCIGKLTPDGQPIYNEYYKTREKINELTAETEANNPETISSTAFVGETLVLNKVSSKTGIADVLTESFGESDARKIISLAYYQICRGKALSNAGDWLAQRGYGDFHLNSQRVSELLERLKEDKINTFFKGWLKKHAESGNQLFDITSISTYGKRNAYAEYGYNRDGENLEQINLALLTSCPNGLPLWYSMLPGSMSDKVVLDYVLSMMKKMEVPKFTFVGQQFRD